MIEYKLKVSPRARKTLKKMGKDKHLKAKLEEGIKDILQDPCGVGTVKSGDLAGVYGYDLYYAGINYELAYIVEKNENGVDVILILVGTRENFYEHLKRYWK